MKRLPLAAVAALVLAAASSAAAPPVFYSDPAWSPDGKELAFTGGAGAGDLFVVNGDGSGLRQLTHSHDPGVADWAAAQPDWSPDGRWIVFKYRSYGFDLIRLDGSGDHVVGAGFDPTWSPRGRKLAFAAWQPGNAETSGLWIWVSNPDGSHKQLVARPKSTVLSYNDPTWSPDGQRLAFDIGGAPDSGARGPEALGVVSRYRGRISYLRTAGHHAFWPDWSPAGGRIVFNDDFHGLAVLNLRTHRVRTLLRTPPDRFPGRPRFSPDGQRIAYPWQGAIWVMNADGSHRRQIFPRS